MLWLAALAVAARPSAGGALLPHNLSASRQPQSLSNPKQQNHTGPAHHAVADPAGASANSTAANVTRRRLTAAEILERAPHMPISLLAYGQLDMPIPTGCRAPAHPPLPTARLSPASPPPSPPRAVKVNVDALVEHVESALTMCCQKGECEDTRGWTFAGHSCQDFETRRICTEARYGEGYAWLSTWESAFNNPSQNCCACGKKMREGPGWECGRTERKYCRELESLGLGVCRVVSAPPAAAARAARPGRALAVLTL